MGVISFGTSPVAGPRHKSDNGVALSYPRFTLQSGHTLPPLPFGPAARHSSALSLTAYVLHIAGIRLLGLEELPGPALHVLLGFIVAVTVFATLWSRHFRRGPLEWLLGKATKPAELVR